MIQDLQTQAELLALPAEKMRAFGAINLLHIKRQVELLLGLIGRDGIFDQYTKHDISHIDEMLSSLEWIVPEPTKKIMSPADWLITVLAIYFHDLGMLVTKEEYDSRASSGFPEFRDKVLFSGDFGVDYHSKVSRLPPGERERFLYQEYVRQHHAERIRRWILGQESQYLGVSHNAMEAVDELLSPLSEQFRRDLALICESHHLDDLNILSKYKPSQPFGNSDAETANLQYAAVLLRTADLLHMTSDRTPSIAFKVINPSDPLSQQEWAKQMAVKRVRPQIGRNKDGNPDPNAPRDTIEVHAYFNSEDGFFGLTSYLAYVGAQLQRSNEWVEGAARSNASPHRFPWRHIDDSGVETVGFLRETYEFTLDQARILDLLTGHTLYNDTRVVLRELVQNSLDAIRLQSLQNHHTMEREPRGKVCIHWDSAERTLTVQDNGTGMTQEIIERHLLKVGASRYQDPEFKKQFPDFVAISRFGIGVLSAFMVADTVEITSCHPDEPKARQLSLRSVHGKYLVRVLEKESHPELKDILPHGTRVKLKLRASAKMPDPVKTAALWIVIPECMVTVQVDRNEPTPVGFNSPREALAEVLQRLQPYFDRDQDVTDPTKVRIEQREVKGVTVAYALQWSEYFREWSFLSPPSTRRLREEEITVTLGTCIGGIRVEFDTPGFRGVPILAMSNASGLSAPKTNVARSGLESTPELSAMLGAVYAVYCGHIANEIATLHKERSFSLTWATAESQYLLSPLLAGKKYDEDRFNAVNYPLLLEEILRLPLLVVEQNGTRKSISPADLNRQEWFWTIDCAFFRHAEMLLREVPGPLSLSVLGTAIGTHELHLPEGPVVCGRVPARQIEQQVFAPREVDKIAIYEEQRRADFRWVSTISPSRWIDVRQLLLRVTPEEILRGAELERERARIILGRGPVEISGLRETIGVNSLGDLFLLPGTPFSEFFVRACEEADRVPTKLSKAVLPFYISTVLDFFLRTQIKPHNTSNIGNLLASIRDTYVHAHVSRTSELVTGADMALLEKAIQATSWRIFDPSAWLRKAD